MRQLHCGLPVDRHCFMVAASGTDRTECELGCTMRKVCFRACRSNGRKSPDFIVRRNTFVIVVCCIDVRFGTMITPD